MSRVTNFKTFWAEVRGAATGDAALALAHSHAQLQELMAAARAANVNLVLPAITAAVAATPSVVRVNQHGDSTNFLTITAATPGVPGATTIATLAVAPAGGDTLAVTNTAGVIAIALANTTASKNTLTLVKAALDLVGGGFYTVALTGSGATQMTGDATNTIAAAAPGSHADLTHGVGLSTAGTAAVAASRTLAVATQ